MTNIVDVSIVTANFNNAKFLQEFFQSIISSTNYPKEIIFIDDCSTDNSLMIVSENNVPNIKVIPLSKNVGFANALNIGVEHATCKYILRVDPDDFIDINRIELQLNYLENNPDVDIVGSNCYYYHDGLKRIIGKTNLKNTHLEILELIKSGNHGIGNGCIMCKTSILKQHKFNQSNFPAEEYDIFSRIILSGARFYNMSDCLLYYRIHKNAISNKTPFSTINKIYELNKLYFNNDNCILNVYRKYYFIRYYRLYLFHFGTIKGYLFLFLSVLSNPKQLFKRLFNKNIFNKLSIYFK